MSETIKAFKGFDKDLKCRDFQYEVGKEYETDKAEVCKSGFHACEYPLDCFGYYAPAKSVYYEVEQSGDLSRHNDGDTKVASSKIKIGAEIGIKGLVEASFEYVKENAKPTKSNHTKNARSANSATGYGSANSATGERSANVSTGENCSNSGAAATLNAAWGKDNVCKGEIGAYLVLSEWGDWDGTKYPLLNAQMVMVDGEKIKSDVWYKLENDEIIEVKERTEIDE